MKKLIIVLLLALIPFVSHAQQGSGTHPQLGEFTATLINKSLRIEYGKQLVVLTNHVTTRENRYVDGFPELVTVYSIYYYDEKVVIICDGTATLINTPWLGLEPIKASND